MRPGVPHWLLVGCAAWLAAASRLVSAVDVVPWRVAPAYVGDVVTVEGDVVQAHLEAATVVLEFAPDEPKAFRVVLLIPLLTDLPHQPQRLYEGKRVRATGTVREFAGRPEMIVRSPDAIEVVGVASPSAIAAAPTTTQPPATLPPPTTPPTTVPPPPPAPPPAPPATTPPTPPPTVAPPTPAPPPPPPPAARAPVSPTPTPPTPAAAPPPTPTVAPPPPPPSPAPARAAQAPEEEEPPRLFERVDPCARARERWRQAAAVANARAADLTRCLQGSTYRCRPASSALAPALSELEWAEQQVESACP